MKWNVWKIIIIAWIVFFATYSYVVPSQAGYDNPGDGIIGLFFIPPFLFLVIITIIKVSKTFTKIKK